MKRFGLVGVAVAALVAMASAPAFAKGPLVPIPGRVVITGPGLQAPITVKGKVYWYEYGLDGSKGSSNEITMVVRDLGLLQAGPDVGWYELPPDPSTLGPGYAVEYYLDVKDGGVTGFGTDVPIKVTLYPYAPERPLVSGSWWSAPPSLRTWLVSRGIPASPPAVVAPASDIEVFGHRAGGELVAILFASVALLAMVFTAAVAGRRRSQTFEAPILHEGMLEPESSPGDLR